MSIDSASRTQFVKVWDLCGYSKLDAKKKAVIEKVLHEAGGSAAYLRQCLQRSGARRALTFDKLARGARDQEGNDVEELVYEGYGPGGVAILVEAMTDNKNRTVAEVRHAFTKYGGNLGTDGSVAYLFDRRGLISFAPGADEDEVMDVALDAGAEDVDSDEEGALTVITTLESFGRVVDAFRAREVEPGHAEVAMVPSSTSICDADTAEKNLLLIDALEDLEDVQNVYSNGDFPDSVLAL
jgi:YebC/PmpR family DNA-binding regulatory protein